jgi:hypothetical protein
VQRRSLNFVKKPAMVLLREHVGSGPNNQRIGRVAARFICTQITSRQRQNVQSYMCFVHKHYFTCMHGLLVTCPTSYAQDKWKYHDAEIEFLDINGVDSLIS